MVRELIHQVLQSYGYQVLDAANGDAALAFCERYEQHHVLRAKDGRVTLQPFLVWLWQAFQRRDRRATFTTDLISRDPFHTGREQFLLGIDRYDVGAHSADAPVRTEADLWHQASVEFIKTLQHRHQPLAA